MHRQSVKGGWNGSDVLPLTCSSQKMGCCILDQLESWKRGLTDSIIKCIAVIHPRCDEGWDYLLKVLSCKKWLHLCQLPQVKKAGLDNCADLTIYAV